MNQTNSSFAVDEDSLLGVAYWAIKSLICLVTIFGNGVVMWLVCTKKRLHCAANWYVLSLASADFCTGLLITPVELLCLWKPATCIQPMKARQWFYNYPINVSVCCLCMLTFDRYCFVLSPLKYTRSITSKRVTGLITTSWIFPRILTFAPLLWTKAAPGTQETVDKVHIMILMILVTFLPSICLVYSYSKIFFAAMKHRRLSADHTIQLRFNQGNRATKRVQSQRSRDRSSIVKILGVVIAFFVLCWVLSLYRAVCTMFRHCSVSSSVVKISRLLILLNSGINFVVYAFFKKDIRNGTEENASKR